MSFALRRPSIVRSAVLAAVAGASLYVGVSAALASMVYSDLNDFNLTESTSSYGGGTQYHVGTYNSTGQVDFRWLDSPNKSTVISSNSCANLSLNGSDSYGVGDTGYHTLWYGSSQECFVVRGRVTAGSGFMNDHDGRVNR